ncbi:MAG: DNA translocase FtsK 4TM domain-containing protein [Hyphomonadaceae bacterium]|nr:DNA translocase FtsK 4TM domain-containing protein [Hyphomonadaceae bacterium]
MPPGNVTASPDPDFESRNYDYEYARSLMDDPQDGGTNRLGRIGWALFRGGIGGAVFLSLASFSPFDTTRDTAGLGVTQNWLGQPGAELSSLIMQTLGWGGFFLAGLLIFTSVKSVFRPGVKLSRLDMTGRICLVSGTALFGSAWLSAFPIPQSWPMAGGLGGWFGDVIYLGSTGFLERLNFPFSGLLIALMMFVFWAFCLGRCIGIVGRDLLDVWDALGLVWATLRVWCDRVVEFISRRFQGNHVAEVDRANSISTLLRDVDSLEPENYDDVTAPAAQAAAKPEPGPRRPLRLKKPEFHFPDGSDFVLPDVDLLKIPPPRKILADEGALRRTAEQLHQVMDDYGIKGEMGMVRPGPVVTLYEFEPAPGVKSQRVINLAPDIARNMSAKSARIAVVPGRNAMGVELPNRRRETVWLRNMLNSSEYRDSEAGLPLIMGEDIGGTSFIADLSKMPHLLVAGTTGSGKSVAINAMILSLMYRLTPDQCKFIMIDPKMLELSVYDGAPHLLAPVVTEPKKAVVALKWTVREMEDRYRKMSKMGVRNMAGYNEKVREAQARGEVLTRTFMTGYDGETGDPMYETEELNFEPMPFIVVIIDEMADLMMVAGKEIEGAVQRLAQMARAAGIHMIMATQRPSVDVITGTIKANFPTRVSFRVGSSIDSRTILGETGAEHLLGNGDMLFMGTGRPRRLHGPFVSDGEVEKIAAFIKAQGKPNYLEDVTAEAEEDSDDDPMNGGQSLFDQAVAIVAKDRKATTSYIQRRLSIGYNRAANLIERMEAEGMIGPAGPGGKREILLPDHNGY